MTDLALKYDSEKNAFDLALVPKTIKKKEYGILFDGDNTGTNQYIEVTADAASGLRITGDVSVEALVKTSSESFSNGYILRCGLGTNEYYGLSHDAVNERILFGWYDGGFKAIYSGNGTAPNDSILHVVAVRDGTDILLYVEAVDEAVGGTGAATTPTGTPSLLRIGSTLPSVQQFVGTVFESRVYARALSATEVAERARGIYTNVSGQVLHLPISEGKGLTAHDYSGLGNHGTLTNGPQWIQTGTAEETVTDKYADLATDDGLETAVIISLFTDRRAEADDVIPDGTDNRRGWWADQYSNIDGDRIGSRLWLPIDRGKASQDAANEIRTFAIEALQWLIDDGIAKTINATAERVDTYTIALRVQIVKPDNSELEYRFQVLWESHINVV